MPASVVVTVADAVAVSLANAAFSLPIQVSRGYRPVVELSSMSGVLVTVVPKSLAITPASRGDSFYDCAIDIGVQAKVNPGSVVELDDLTWLVEEIISYLRFRALSGASCVSIENDPIFAPEHLEQQHVFTSLLTVTYRMRR